MTPGHNGQTVIWVIPVSIRLFFLFEPISYQNEKEGRAIGSISYWRSGEWELVVDGESCSINFRALR